MEPTNELLLSRINTLEGKFDAFYEGAMGAFLKHRDDLVVINGFKEWAEQRFTDQLEANRMLSDRIAVLEAKQFDINKYFKN